MQALDFALSVPMIVRGGRSRKARSRSDLPGDTCSREPMCITSARARRSCPKKTKQLDFDTSTQAGTDDKGQPVTFAQIYGWMGETARAQVFDLLNRVLSDPGLMLKMFAYDLNEPDIVKILLTLAEQGRARVILDNASLHVTGKTAKVKTPENQFTDLLIQQRKRSPSDIVRGLFARYSHDKVFIVAGNGEGLPIQVLTGSTNFSLTGFYVNANHVLVFQDTNVAGQDDQVFEKSWQVLSNNQIAEQLRRPPRSAARTSPLGPIASQADFVPKMDITFSPHTPGGCGQNSPGHLRSRDRTGDARGQRQRAFCGDAADRGPEPCLQDPRRSPCDAVGVQLWHLGRRPRAIFLYTPAQATGVQVTGKPSQVILPPPFDQVPSPPGHEIRDKFVVCGLNGDDPVVYCGSSNMASGGEAANGDNLLAIHDADVATAFAIEALGLVDHYNFLDRMAHPKAKASGNAEPTAAGKKSHAGVKKAAHKVTTGSGSQRRPLPRGPRKEGRKRPGRASLVRPGWNAEIIRHHGSIDDEESRHEEIDREANQETGDKSYPHCRPGEGQRRKGRRATAGETAGGCCARDVPVYG